VNHSSHAPAAPASSVTKDERDYRLGVVAEAADPSASDDLDDDVETRRTVVDSASHQVRLDKVLVAMAPEFSRSHLQGLVERGHVRLDGTAVTTASRKLRFGQRIEVDLVPTAESLAFRPEAMPLAALFEDEHLMVIDKPAGLVVHPAAGHWEGTLLNALLAHHPGAARLPRAGIVHRLDKDTSGLMVVAKTLQAMTALVRAIAARDVHREYQAIAHGRYPLVSSSIDAPIGRDPRSRVRMAIVPGGKTARTDVLLIASALGASALRCTLHTGRTHQIRVHLASRGHPLVADALYGGSPLLGLTRQALHAAALRFEHPVTGEPLSFEATPPADLAQAWTQVTA
jgi:23S rRNA pseudouridine1911/1915/1917 synthase